MPALSFVFGFKLILDAWSHHPFLGVKKVRIATFACIRVNPVPLLENSNPTVGYKPPASWRNPKLAPAKVSGHHREVMVSAHMVSGPPDTL